MNFTFQGQEYPWYGRMPDQQWRKLRQAVYQRDEGMCQYCLGEVELFQCHIHHVLPLSEGGTNRPGNLKTLCVDCHQYRHPFMLDDIKRISEWPG